MPDLVDQDKTLEALYGASAKAPALADVPELDVITADGVGDPAVSAEFRSSIEALMTFAWGIRTLRSARQPSQVIRVMPLERRWTWPGIAFSGDPAVWAYLQWSLQIVQPSNVTVEELEQTRDIAMKKKPNLTRLADGRLETVPAHRAATMLHVGPFTTEPETIARIHEAIANAGGTPGLGYRDLYLSDLRRVAPGKLRTLLRVAMR